jgi:hypothetical protein
VVELELFEPDALLLLAVPLELPVLDALPVVGAPDPLLLDALPVVGALDPLLLDALPVVGALDPLLLVAAVFDAFPETIVGEVGADKLGRMSLLVVVAVPRRPSSTVVVLVPLSTRTSVSPPRLVTLRCSPPAASEMFEPGPE